MKRRRFGQRLGEGPAQAIVVQKHLLEVRLSEQGCWQLA
jgi:hypothetical protein